jgi:predicted dithiol-disulfide oxidoreductase (DUF899 family)
MRPLQYQTWETFSVNWQTDVTIAFTWLRAVFHTYSCYVRGIDMAPRGRDEDGPEGPQAWVQYHDRDED